MKTLTEIKAETNRKCAGCKYLRDDDCRRNSEWWSWRHKDFFTNASYPNGLDISCKLPCYKAETEAECINRTLETKR